MVIFRMAINLEIHFFRGSSIVLTNRRGVNHRSQVINLGNVQTDTGPAEMKKLYGIHRLSHRDIIIVKYIYIPYVYNTTIC